MRHFFLASIFTAAAFAQQPCSIRFSVIWKDSLNNIKQGLRAEDREWLDKKMSKKYPELCYDSGAPPIALFVNLDDATYHGTKTVESSHTEPVEATVTDSSGNLSNVNGTTTTTTSREVPYSFNYRVMTMSVEVRQKDGTWKVVHNFRHDTLQKQWYGIALTNRHPNQQLIESALKWIHDGGLTDPYQTVLP